MASLQDSCFGQVSLNLAEDDAHVLAHPCPNILPYVAILPGGCRQLCADGPVLPEGSDCEPIFGCLSSIKLRHIALAAVEMMVDLFAIVCGIRNPRVGELIDITFVRK